MARRTRRFESLEERRLLAAVASSPDATALVGAADPSVSPASQPSSSASAADGASSDSTPGDSTPGDSNPGEYAAAATADPSSGASGYDTYTEYSSPTAADHYTDPAATKYDPPANSSLATSPAPTSSTTNQGVPSGLAQLLQPVQASVPTAEGQAVVILPIGPAGTPASGAPVGPVRFDPHDLVARAELNESASEAAAPAAIAGDEQPLVAPVAWATSGAQRTIGQLDADDTDYAAPPIVEEPSLFDASPQIVGLITGAVNGDWSKIERSVDELFDRLDRLGDELPSAATAWHVGECVALTAGAAAAFEYVRAQFREGGTWQGFIDGEREPWEPRLRRRWFRRKVERIARR
ncbi:MAG TPA: hypothetical protein VJ783_14295 [Pirellulales bacterium]|nr:hypothetical protein [Pirellulales bacterium]